jgi:hypothetical protein
MHDIFFGKRMCRYVGTLIGRKFKLRQESNVNFSFELKRKEKNFA